MSKWIEQKTKSALPFYFAGLTWLVCGLLFPLYQLVWLLVTLAASVGVFALTARFCPDRVRRQEVNYSTGAADVDEMLQGIDTNLSLLHDLNEKIPDASLSECMTRMEKAGRGILAEVEAHPEKAKVIRRFANNYLPDSIHVLQTYADLQSKGVTGTNAQQIGQEVNKNAAIIATAFENQLDALYSAESMDISVDLEVLHGIMKGQGLVDDNEMETK